MLIKNNTNLSYKEIGNIIDQIISMGSGDTHYYGQIQYTTFETDKGEYAVQIRYLKRYVEWIFTEGEKNKK